MQRKSEKNEKLSKREKTFAKIYAETRDKRRAAYEAGYRLLPLQTAINLLERKAVRDYIETLCASDSKTAHEAETGFRRLAFGSSADAVRLIFSESLTDEQIEQLDLFNVAEIKKPKGGGIEIKFFDRLKALEALNGLTSLNSDGALPFYRALENSAQKAASQEWEN
jgi:hypothetical protein